MRRRHIRFTRRFRRAGHIVELVVDVDEKRSKQANFVGEGVSIRNQSGGRGRSGCTRMPQGTGKSLETKIVRQQR